MSDYIYIRTYMHIHTCRYVYAHTHMHMPCVYAYTLCMHMCACIYIYAHVHAYRICMCVRIYTSEYRYIGWYKIFNTQIIVLNLTSGFLIVSHNPFSLPSWLLISDWKLSEIFSPSLVSSIDVCHKNKKLLYY